MNDTRTPDSFHTKRWITRKDQLASRLFHAALARNRPEPDDLAKALAFVGSYRKRYGYESRGGKLENICLGMETVLAVSLGGWIEHRDGLHEDALRHLPGLEAKSA